MKAFAATTLVLATALTALVGQTEASTINAALPYTTITKDSICPDSMKPYFDCNAILKHYVGW